MYTSRMRIGLDVRTLGGRFTGDRTYWRGLINGLAAAGFGAIDPECDEFFLYLREPLPFDAGMPPLPGNFTWRIVESSSDRLWAWSALPRAARRDGIDVMHVQYSVSPLFAVPVVTTVHDVTFRLFPQLFSLRDQVLLNLTVPSSVRRACRVLAVSESTRRDILKAYPATTPAKVVTTLLAAGSEFRPFSAAEQEAARILLRDTYGVSGPYALAVGVLQPRKNLPMLLKAFRSARRLKGFEQKLVVTGKRGWLTSEIDSAIAAAEVGGSGDILLTGYVPDEHLPLLYACADAMLYPSLYEGFGLPPLEAMACGCPVLVSSTSSLPEVVGSAGMLLDPTRPGDWIDAIGLILTHEAQRERLSAAGLERSKQFGWKRTALQTIEVYKACHNEN